MSNMLVDVSFTVDIPRDKMAELVGRADDGSNGWWEQGTAKAIEYVRDDPMGAIEQYSHDEPEVDI
jgi:hypothetical protein